MDNKLKESLRLAELEFEKEPMRDLYHKKIIGFPSRLRIKKILKEIGNLKGKKVLDIGCEEGYISLRILSQNPEELYSIDICEKALESFRKKISTINTNSKVIIEKGFLQKIPFKSNFFDFVICTEVIEHTPYLEEGLKEIHRVLKPNGILILTFPNEKLRRLVYPFIKPFGVNVDVVEKATIFEYPQKEVKNKLLEFFRVEKYHQFPFYFPITNFFVCVKEK